MSTPDFRSDLARGREHEADVAALLPGAGPTARHRGDLAWQGIDIEVKADVRAGETGNVVVELVDFYPGKGVAWVTGVGKHSTQDGRRLVVHRVGTGERWLVYEPVVTFRWAREAALSRDRSLRQVRPWPNGTGRTFGLVVPAGRLPAVAAESDGLADVIGSWPAWDGTVLTVDHCARVAASICRARLGDADPVGREFVVRR